jgi:hypothetical protein
MLWTLRLSLLLLIAGIFLSPQIIAYAVVASAMRLWRLVLKAFTRVKMAMRRLLVFGSMSKQEVS